MMPNLPLKFGNCTDIKPVRVASVIRNFAKKFGCVLENVGRQSTGKRHRTYAIKVDVNNGLNLTPFAQKTTFEN